MDKGAKTIVIVVIAGVFFGLAIVEFVSMRNGGQSPISQAVRGMLDAPEPVPDAATTAAAEKTDPASKDRRPASSSSSSSSTSTVRPPAGTAMPAPAPTPAPVVVVPRPQPPISNAAPVFSVHQRRSDTFVPGNLRGWIGYGVTFDQPLLVRAGGEVRAGDQVSGPNGLKEASGIPHAGGAVPDTRVRVLG